MSGLDNFFAKKDRKKKKSSSRTTIAPPIETKPAEVTPEEPLPKVAPPPPKPVDVDDGWIEIDDPRGSQVNTGGRTIVEFRRDVEDKEQNGEGAVPIEKFSGWGKAETEQPKDEKSEKSEKFAAAPGNITSAAFPSLADAANAPELPVSRGKSTSDSGVSSNPSRPRFIISNTEKLRQKLAERDASRVSK